MIDQEKINEIKRRYENVPELPYDAYMWHVHTKRYRDITACLANIRTDIPYLLATITELGREMEAVHHDIERAAGLLENHTDGGQWVERALLALQKWRGVQEEDRK